MSAPRSGGHPFLFMVLVASCLGGLCLHLLMLPEPKADADTNPRLIPPVVMERVAAAQPTAITPPVASVSDVELITKFDRLEVPPNLRPIITDAATKNGLDPIFLAAHLRHESGAGFPNVPCRKVKGTHICGIAQQADAWGTREQRMDVTWAINRMASADKENLDAFGGDTDKALRQYFSGRPTMTGGTCPATVKKHGHRVPSICNEYPGIVYNFVAIAEGRA